MKTRVTIFVLAALVISFFAYQNFTSQKESVPKTKSTVTKLAPSEIRAEGHLMAYPGQDITLSAEQGGRILKMTALENTEVSRGQLLVEIDAQELRAALKEAQARVFEVRTERNFQAKRLGRQSSLVDSGVLSDELFEKDQQEVSSAEARLLLAQAAVDRLRVLIDKTRIESPISGTVLLRYVNVGESVAAGTALLRIAQLARLRVEAEVDEFDAAHVQAGASVTIHAEGYPQIWSGKVEEISSAVSARRTKPQDPGRPVDTQVLLVKIGFDGSHHPLKLGQRVEVNIHVGK